jgi:hypothetical protein
VLLFLAVCVAAIGFIRIKDPIKIFLLAAYLVFSFFMLAMKMHERYLFPTLALLAPVALMGSRWLILYVVVSLSLLLSLFHIFPLPDIERFPFPQAFQLVITAINIAAYVWLSSQLLMGQLLPSSTRAKATELAPPNAAIPPGRGSR